MRKDYFIMMSNQSGEAIFPIVDEDEDVMLFETHEAAHKLAEDHDFCKAFGYEIFCRGRGEY